MSAALSKGLRIVVRSTAHIFGRILGSSSFIFAGGLYAGSSKWNKHWTRISKSALLSFAFSFGGAPFVWWQCAVCSPENLSATKPAIINIPIRRCRRRPPDPCRRIVGLWSVDRVDGSAFDAY